ncbi:MAG: hypothetical protein GY947_13765 [Rhodobacteraceae bacterium]|nr:hypothetical protein [Paracoccaceae bacterium]
MRKRKIVWINPTKKVSKKAQVDAATAVGVDPDYDAIWINGSGGGNIHEFIKSLREGDPIYVYTSDLFAPNPNKRSGETRRDLFRKVAELLLDKGVRVHELKTGRSCGSKRELVQMMLDARDAIAGTSGTGKDPGRPPKFDRENKRFLRDIGGIWYNRDHADNPARLTAVQKRYPGFTKNDWYKLRPFVDIALNEPPTEERSDAK